MVEYLSAADVMALHEAIMERTGASPAPLRDVGLLESAVMRPQTAAYYERADLVRQSALLAVGISQNQPFVDGNKRTAYAALDVFLRINSCAYAGDPIELADQLVRIAEQTQGRGVAIDGFASWLRRHVTCRP